jgi:hypothetical protein
MRQGCAMVSWKAFATTRPDLAEAGRALLYQYGVGLAFLATTDRNGAPRVHPMCPLLDVDELCAFLVPSPKREDLRRDGRYAMHSFPCEDNEDAFYLTGLARPVDRGRWEPWEVRFLAERTMPERPVGFEEQELFAFDIERCLLTRSTGHGDPTPRHEVWRAAP